MKKICGFLAALLVLFSVGTIVDPIQEVNAFSSSEINYQDFSWYCSGKAGADVEFYASLVYTTASELDVSGWKAALCPENHVTLEDAVAVFDISNTDKVINTEYNYAYVSLTAALENDIPEGNYQRVVFDAEGNVRLARSSEKYVNQQLAFFECDLINDDGYAYAYVYAENTPLSAETYPTFYAADKTTPVTSFNDYATEINSIMVQLSRQKSEIFIMN